MLIRFGADLNAQSKQQETALMAAAKANHVEIAALLLENNADVDQVDKVS